MKKKTFTACLYDGAVTEIENIIAVEKVKEEDINNINPLIYFYDVAEVGTNYTKYQNRITKHIFTVYYYRTLEISDTVHTYDYGSHTRFLAVFEGKFTKEELADKLKEAVKDKI